MTIALKIDVDTWRGTREGVPALVETLRAHGAGATFLFSLGPDHTGRALRRAFRPGFLAKASRTSVLEHYGLRTLLYGVLLPGPDIGRSCAAILRGVRDGGFEVGVHCWDHVRWQDGVAQHDRAWAAAEMNKARRRFIEIFDHAPLVHGAAGWQMSADAYALEAELGFWYASDGRGTHAYWPSIDGRRVGVPQLPTTLPTLDELLGRDGWTPDNVHHALLRATAGPSRDIHVYTLHAELEGMKLRPVFERLLAGWREQGHAPQAMCDVMAGLDSATLPLHEIGSGTVPGRSGVLAVQGQPA
ncbi:polysaccharide deacetylase family protein [Solimonas soli]|uniref:polysaccharide deacetylase family protein n=1 Tax=Solimonas soli TaxID=413479 RepID=UPI0004821B91|nr:polysaccharide deacetylase family protein [Solimonas soli]